MSAKIVIFDLSLPLIGSLAASCVFDAERPFHLLSAAAQMELSADTASRIGGAASRGAHRLRAAAARDEVPRPGMLYQLLGPDGGPLFKIAIDADGATLFELDGAPSVRLPGAAGLALLDALTRLGEHARSVGGGNSLGLAQ